MMIEYRFTLQGKLEFSIRTSGYIVRKMNYTDLFSEPGRVVTPEELKKFEVTMGKNVIPDNLKVGDMWSLFKHYDSQSWIMEILKWGGLALGIGGVVLVVYMGVSRFCPRLVGKQVGFSPQNQQRPGTTIKIFNDNRGNDDQRREDHDEQELQEMNRDNDREDTTSRERSTSMSVKSALLKSPTFSRTLIGKMTQAQKKALCDSADVIRQVDGFKTYATESEDSEPEGDAKKIEAQGPLLHRSICRNCGKSANECQCATGLVPPWLKDSCVVCIKDKQHCDCKEFTPHGKYFPWADESLRKDGNV